MDSENITYNYRETREKELMIDIFPNEFNKRGTIFQAHWHEHLQFFFFQRGEAVIYCNSRELKAGPGDLIIVNSNELHFGRSLSDNLFFHIIKIDSSYLTNSKPDLCHIKYFLPLSQNLILFQNRIKSDDLVRGCINGLIKEFLTKEKGFELAIKSHIYNLLAILIRRYTEKFLDLKEYDIRINKLKRFQKVIQYIEDNLTERIEISQLAKLINVNVNYFCRLFKSFTGKSAFEYINVLRVNKTIALLMSTEMNITEVALAAGFSDANYYSRVFRKHKGVSPLQYRRNLSNNKMD